MKTADELQKLIAAEQADRAAWSSLTAEQRGRLLDERRRARRDNKEAAPGPLQLLLADQLALLASTREWESQESLRERATDPQVQHQIEIWLGQREKDLELAERQYAMVSTIYARRDEAAALEQRITLERAAIAELRAMDPIALYQAWHLHLGNRPDAGERMQKRMSSAGAKY